MTVRLKNYPQHIRAWQQAKAVLAAVLMQIIVFFFVAQAFRRALFRRPVFTAFPLRQCNYEEGK
jgi:hypothetical protein